MPRDASVDDGASERHADDAVITNFRKSLSRSGGGGGVSLHIDAAVAAEFGLDENTEVAVDVLEEDGDVAFRITDIPAGFTRAALREHANQQGWEETDSYEDEAEWSLTYRDPTDLVRIEVDSTTRIDGAVVNNVFVHGVPIEVDEDLDRYKALCAVAMRKDLRVRVRDSEGYWARLQSAADGETDDAPDDVTFEQLLDATDWVTTQLVDERASLNTSLEEISTVVHSIRSAMNEYYDATQPDESADSRSAE